MIRSIIITRITFVIDNLKRHLVFRLVMNNFTERAEVSLGWYVVDMADPNTAERHMRT